MIKKYIFTLTILIAVNHLWCQKDPLMEMAMEHFGKPEAKSVWWLKDFKGFYDQCHEIRMVLATDNNSFKGAYEFLSSGEKFYLDGNYDGEQIILVESDSLGRTTGIFKGDMNDDAFYAEWSDPKNIAQVTVYLSTGKPSVFPCGNIGWAHHYSAKGPDSLKKVSVWKYEDQVQILLFYPGSHRRIEMECLDDQCQELNQLTGDIDDESHWNLSIDKQSLINVIDQKEYLYNLKSNKSIYFDCKTFMDFDDKYSLVYPISGSIKFNNWVMSAWTDKYSNSGKYSHKQQNNFSVSDRVSHEEYGNVILDFFNDKLISGVFTIQSSKYAEATEIPFTYLFEKDKEVSIAEIFLPEVAQDSVVEQLVKEIKVDRADGDEFSRYAAGTYRILSISAEGLVCRTPFSTLYGQDKIVLDKEKLKRYLKKNAVPIW